MNDSLPLSNISARLMFSPCVLLRAILTKAVNVSVHFDIIDQLVAIALLITPVPACSPYLHSETITTIFGKLLEYFVEDVTN